jgi:hypothetical protein
MVWTPGCSHDNDKNYYSKVEHRGRYGSPDVRMMMTKDYYSWTSRMMQVAGYSHDDDKKLL